MTGAELACEDLIASLPEVSGFIVGDPHDLPPFWGTGPGPAAQGPDILQLNGIERLLTSIQAETKARLFAGMSHTDAGFWGGIAQLAWGSVVAEVLSDVEFEAVGVDHPVDVLAHADGLLLMSEVKFWDWPGAVAAPNGVWTAPIAAPGVEDAVDELLGRQTGRGSSRAAGRGRVTQLRDHFELAAGQLIANDQDHRSVRIPVVMTRAATPGEYFEDAMRGEAAYVIDPSAGAAVEIRPFDHPQAEGFEPTGLANRRFASEIDLAVWLSFDPVSGYRGALLVGDGSRPQVVDLGEALKGELQRRQDEGLIG